MSAATQMSPPNPVSDSRQRHAAAQRAAQQAAAAVPAAQTALDQVNARIATANTELQRIDSLSAAELTAKDQLAESKLVRELRQLEHDQAEASAALATAQLAATNADDNVKAAELAIAEAEEVEAHQALAKWAGDLDREALARLEAMDKSARRVLLLKGQEVRGGIAMFSLPDMRRPRTDGGAGFVKHYTPGTALRELANGYLLHLDLERNQKR